MTTKENGAERKGDTRFVGKKLELQVGEIFGEILSIGREIFRMVEWYNLNLIEFVVKYYFKTNSLKNWADFFFHQIDIFFNFQLEFNKSLSWSSFSNSEI